MQPGAASSVARRLERLVEWVEAQRDATTIQGLLPKLIVNEGRVVVHANGEELLGLKFRWSKDC